MNINDRIVLISVGACLFVCDCVFVFVYVCKARWSTGTLNIGGIVYLYIMEGKPQNWPTGLSKPKPDCSLLIAFIGLPTSWLERQTMNQHKVNTRPVYN